MILTKLGMKLAPLIIKAVPPLAKYWKKKNGAKASPVLIGAGVLMFVLGAPEVIGVGLIVAGGEELINSLGSKAYRKTKGE